MRVEIIIHANLPNNWFSVGDLFLTVGRPQNSKAAPLAVQVTAQQQTISNALVRATMEENETSTKAHHCAP